MATVRLVTGRRLEPDRDLPLAAGPNLVEHIAEPGGRLRRRALVRVPIVKLAVIGGNVLRGLDCLEASPTSREVT